MRRFLLSGLVGALAAWAQGNVGRISGTVTDSSGALVPGCSVTVLDPSTGVKITGATQANGVYVFASVPTGKYDIKAEKQGFNREVESGVVLDAASNRTVDFTLKPGAVTETVQVQAEAAQVQTDSAVVSSTVNSRQVEEIALNGRNFMQLMFLQPGAVQLTTNPFTLSLSDSQQRIDGIRSTSIHVSIDGMSNMDAAGTLNMSVSPSPDALDEVRVLTSNYSAEFGSHMGAQTNLVIKSGTKDFHGSLFEFARNNITDARSFFSQAVSPLHFNDFGGTLGGPVFIPGKFNSARDKLFFFTSEERKTPHTGTTNTDTVPTALERQGNFQGSGLTPPVDPTTGTPFPNQIIPQNRWSSNGPRLLSPYPLPNSSSTGGINYIFESVTESDTFDTVNRFDYIQSPKTQWNYRFLRDSWAGIVEPSSLPNEGDHRPRPGYVTSLGVTHTFSPTLLFSASFGVEANRYDTYPDIDPPTYLRSTMGLTYPYLFPNTAGYRGIDLGPGVSVTGFTSISDTGTPYRYESQATFQGNYDITKVAGKHILKFGALLMRHRRNQIGLGGTNGSFAFATTASDTSKNALADALLGNFYTYSETEFAPSEPSRVNQFEFYAQDSWAATRKLHLELGVRYYYIPNNYFTPNIMDSFLPSLYSLSQAPQIDPKTGYIVPGTGDLYNGIALWGNGWSSNAKGLPQYNNPALKPLFGHLPFNGSPNEHKDVGPRVGLAYDPFGDGRTSIRGGFGIYYDRVATDQPSETIANNPPFNISTTVRNGAVDNPGGGGAPILTPSIASYTTQRVPRVMEFDFNVQRELPGHIILDVGYVGNVQRHARQVWNINQLLPGTTLAHPGVNVNALEPYPGYGSISLTDDGENTNYNSMQVIAGRRFSTGLSFSSNFTWSRALDYSTGGGEPGGSYQNFYNTKIDYGLSDIQRKFVFHADLQYDLPFFKRSGTAIAKAVLGGWTTSTVFSAQSGAPASVTVSGDPAGIGASSSRATNIGNPNDVTDRTVFHWFNTAVFLPLSLMTSGQFGTSGKNILIGPGFWQLDGALFKDFKVKERIVFQLRVETFNTLNHPSFTSIGTTVGTSTFGQATAASPGRVFQLALKMRF